MSCSSELTKPKGGGWLESPIYNWLVRSTGDNLDL